MKTDAAVGTAAETAWLDVLAPSDHVGTSRKLLQEQQQQLAARAADSNSKRTSNSSDAPGDEEDGWVQSLQQQALPAWARASNLIKPAADGQCPGCVAGSCFDTDQGPRCTSCLGSLFVFRSDGTCGESALSNMAMCFQEWTSVGAHSKPFGCL